MTRFVCISDTHGLHREMEHPLPEGDVLIHSGDLSNCLKDVFDGKLHDINLWLQEIQHKYTQMIFVPGNHDEGLEYERRMTMDMLTAGVGNLQVLINNSYTFGRYNIHGVPQTPQYMGWAFNAERGERIRRFYNNIPRDTNILVTHGPPHGILDKFQGQSFGCEDLRKTVFQLMPKLHVFGHIHTGYGVATSRRRGKKMIAVNAAIANAPLPKQAMKASNAPIVVDLP